MKHKKNPPFPLGRILAGVCKIDYIIITHSRTKNNAPDYLNCENYNRIVSDDI